MISKMLGDLTRATLRATAHREVDRMSVKELGDVIRRQQPLLGRAYVLVTSEATRRAKVHKALDGLSDQRLSELAANKLAEAVRRVPRTGN